MEISILQQAGVMVGVGGGGGGARWDIFHIHFTRKEGCASLTSREVHRISGLIKEMALNSRLQILFKDKGFNIRKCIPGI